MTNQPDEDEEAAEKQLMIQVPMAQYNQMEGIVRDVKRAIEYPIKRLEEQLKDEHQRLVTAYRDIKELRIKWREALEEIAALKEKPTPPQPEGEANEK